MLSQELRETLIDALGVGWKGKGRTPWRNRTACNTRNAETFGAHDFLARPGLIVRDPAQDYGRMLVYRVTDKGALAVTGKKLPKKLAALIPQAEPEAQALAA